MKKYLYLLPLLISVISLAFFIQAYNEIMQEKFEQKFGSIRNDVSLIATETNILVERDQDWGIYDYAADIVLQVSQINDQQMVYAGLFDTDMNLLSDQYHDEGIKNIFNPLDYPEFRKAVQDNNKGTVTITYNDGTRPPYKMRLYYEKTPSGNYKNKYTVVAGVSQYSIDDNFAAWVGWGVGGFLVVTVGLQIWMIFRISKLSHPHKGMEI